VSIELPPRQGAYCTLCALPAAAAACPARWSRDRAAPDHASVDVRACASRLPSPPHSKAAIDAAKLLNLKKFSMSSNMNMEHDSMVVNRLVSSPAPAVIAARRGGAVSPSL
jgi:hypothetical protein